MKTVNDLCVYRRVYSVSARCTMKTDKFTLSLKFKRVSLNETSEFPFWGLIISVDFDLRDFIKMVRYKGLNKIIFQNKNIDIYKTGLTHL